jgi:hypothetical protein
MASTLPGANEIHQIEAVAKAVARRPTDNEGIDERVTALASIGELARHAAKAHPEQSLFPAIDAITQAPTARAPRRRPDSSDLQATLTHIVVLTEAALETRSLPFEAPRPKSRFRQWLDRNSNKPIAIALITLIGTLSAPLVQAGVTPAREVAPDQPVLRIEKRNAQELEAEGLELALGHASDDIHQLLVRVLDLPPGDSAEDSVMAESMVDTVRRARAARGLLAAQHGAAEVSRRGIEEALLGAPPELRQGVGEVLGLPRTAVTEDENKWLDEIVHRYARARAIEVLASDLLAAAGGIRTVSTS